MLGLANALTTWSRGVYDPVTQATLPNQLTYTDLPAHVDIIPSTSFHELPASARKTTYLVMVDSGADIVTGDFMAGCVNILTGQQWPQDYPDDESELGWGNTIWCVRFHHEVAAGAGAYRALYLEKVQVGGPASPF